MTKQHGVSPQSRRTATILLAALAATAALSGVPLRASAEEEAQAGHAQPAGAATGAVEAQAGGEEEIADAAVEGIDDGRHLAVITLGATGERELADRFTHVGPAVGIEVEPIEHWLEVELGASAYRRRGIKGFELEMPFKKPFELAEGFEVMPGVGPTWMHTTEDGSVARVWGAEALIDFFYWPTRRAGWYLAPSYGTTLGSKRQKSVALSFGVFFAIP